MLRIRWNDHVVVVVVGLLLVVYCNNGVHSFVAPTTGLSRRQNGNVCWAKPPSAKFDLEAIEAFEALLLEQERLMEDEDLDDNDDIGGQLQQRPLSSVVDVRTYTVPAELHKKRIDAAIATLIENETTAAASDVYSRSFCGNLVTDGRVTVDQQIVARKSYKVEVGQQLQLQLLLSNGGETVTEIIAQDLPLNILFEDAHMIVLNKAAGMVVHPAAGNWDGTVVNALAYYLRHTSPYSSSSGNDDFFVKNRENNGNESVDDTNDCATDSNNDNSFDSFRPGIVHRLDKGTTGVLVVAKTPTALAALSEQFATRQVKKTYLAVTVGNPGKRVVIDKPIGRHPVYRQRMRVVPDPHQKDSSGMTPADRKQMRENNDSLSTLSQSGRRALSLVDTIAFDGKLALVQVRIETGRTHQIRVHLQDRHTPIYGDDIYGLADWNKRLNKTHAVERPLLHAYKLQLQHPVTGETMLFQAPLADDMRKIAKTIYPQGEEEMPEVFFTAKDGSE